MPYVKHTVNTSIILLKQKTMLEQLEFVLELPFVLKVYVVNTVDYFSGWSNQPDHDRRAKLQDFLLAWHFMQTPNSYYTGAHLLSVSCELYKFDKSGRDLKGSDFKLGES